MLRQPRLDVSDAGCGKVKKRGKLLVGIVCSPLYVVVDADSSSFTAGGGDVCVVFSVGNVDEAASQYGG